MGKRYYCDYCEKTMSCALSIIRTHNDGLAHQKLVKEHYQKYKAASTILAEESKKTPCKRFFEGQCRFGGLCRLSHYSWEQMECLKNFVHTKNLADRVVTQPCFQDLYNKLQKEKSLHRDDDNTVLVDDSGVAHILPWSYNSVLEGYDDLPPSIKKLKLQDFNNAKFTMW